VVTIKRVTFGDVYVCSGQSNMALEAFYTFSADQLKEEILAGKYAKLKLFEYGGMGYNCSLASWTPTWVTAKNSISDGKDDGSFKWYGAAEAASVPYAQRAEGMMSALQHFSATCLYFGVELLDALGPDAPPIGLIQTAVGGSTIEAWMSNETLGRCSNEFNFSYGNPSKGTGIRSGVSKDQHIPGTLHYGYLAPFANTSVSGFLWCE
jgi:sialate O-acetylesterase